MKTTILKQKEERDLLLKIDYQNRYAFEKAVLFRDAHPIKLITGPRRAGKSVLALQILSHQSFAYLNFDDQQLLDKFDEDAVEQALSEVYPGYQYLLLDEVQNLDNWSLWVEKLYRRGCNLIITGSNANMLSNDMAAVLSGRYLEIRLFPFSALEYLQYLEFALDMETPLQISQVNNVLSEYLANGGFPEVAKTPQVVNSYLSSLYDTIIVKDIVLRYKVRKVDELYRVADWLLSNFTNLFSLRSIAEELEISSVATVSKYCTYLQNTYLFLYLPRFSNKLKLMAKADRKVYVVDNGFVAARAFEVSKNSGRLLENMVFLELLKRDYDLQKYELFYYKSLNGRETDFVCRRGVKVEQLIQVCYEMVTPKTRKREIDALLECAKDLDNNCLTIITWNQEEIIEQNGYTIKVVPLRKWIQGD